MIYAVSIYIPFASLCAEPHYHRVPLPHPHISNSPASCHHHHHLPLLTFLRTHSPALRSSIYFFCFGSVRTARTHALFFVFPLVMQVVDLFVCCMHLLHSRAIRTSNRIKTKPKPSSLLVAHSLVR
ncbi:hypothetical protein DM02DRAFT_96296 [Periconia macrospinosa]|uniref:Uncharacterized protein n=1 Tax=Periconia macrospinosa TaxID=97972 RepID=A0A2V1DFY1_9PLEO|nr:hypothetical protein DM02DRAFT_96296 [Periconia macrospinosa]